jgi:hypothetical protein
MKRADNPTDNLCDTCEYGCIAACPCGEVEWGENVGADNVVGCENYEPK